MSFTITAFGQQEGSVLERQVSIYAENQSLSSILDQISWQSRVFFSYDATIIDSDKKYSIDIVKKSLFTLLHKLFDPDKFQLSELENQIIITPKEKQTIPEADIKRDSIKPKYFFLSGKILENKKKKPLSYASVSVLNQPIGTITNTDGEFILKLHPNNIYDTLIISCMGFARINMPAYKLLDENIIFMKPVSIRIREIKVTSVDPQKLLENIRKNINTNYADHSNLMNSFYRETVKQDGKYINVSEAIIEILKVSYDNKFRKDLVRLRKGRQSPDVQQFKWLNFKLQGGPFTITKLDIIKNYENFLNEEYEDLYKYKISKVIRYKDYSVYVLDFEPVPGKNFYGFVGSLYVHRQSFAVVHAEFGFNRRGLKKARSILIKRKPPGVKARPSYVEYSVDYQEYKGKWHFSNARASLKIKIRSHRDDINSEFHSLSELLVTDIKKTELKKFQRRESFKEKDIFVDMIGNYDPRFWGNYNIIKPDEDLENAIPELSKRKN